MLLNELQIRKLIRERLEVIDDTDDYYQGFDDDTVSDGTDSISKGAVQGSKSLDSLDTAAKDNLVGFVNALKEKGYEVIITSAYRSIAKQAGITSTQGQDVASPGKSPHNFGLGIDMNIKWTDSSKKVNQLMMASSNAEWEKIIGDNGVVPYKDYKLRWGGNFKKRDAVHFDVYNDPSIKIDGILAKNNARKFVGKLRNKAGKGVDKKYSEIKHPFKGTIISDT
jgi:hypothetical protein|tara:strand:+ start:2920 stop:3591 length:672 start_codon:yes stop_codon:yes gene_type:complete